MALRPDSGGAHLNLGAVLQENGWIEEAAAEYRKAIELDPKYAAAHNNLGLVLYAQGKREEATAEYRKAIELDPKFALARKNLGSLLLNQGKFAEAKEHLRAYVDLLDPSSPAHAEAAEQLQRCEHFLVLEAALGPVLRGDRQPADNDERLGLAAVCELQHRNAAGASLYRDALAADPKRADNLDAGTRYNGACLAALAGCGQGEDAKELDDKAKAGWRKQAPDWLRADLDLWGKRLQSDKQEERKAMVEALGHWREDADLSGLRDEAELTKLPADEREACKKLWADVQALLDKADAMK